MVCDVVDQRLEMMARQIERLLRVTELADHALARGAEAAVPGAPQREAGRQDQR